MSDASNADDTDLNLDLLHTPHTNRSMLSCESDSADTMRRLTWTVLSACLIWLARSEEPKISAERVVFQIAQGDIEFAFFPEVMVHDLNDETPPLISGSELPRWHL